MYTTFQAASEKKNVLFLVSDDMRPNLGAYQMANDPLFRSPPMYTPNLDELAGESMVFLNAFCQQALCGPSRTSFLTSRRPDTTRVVQCNVYWRNTGGNFSTISQFFSEQGYITLGGGKILPEDDLENDPFTWSIPFHHSKATHEMFSQRDAVWKAFNKTELEKEPLTDTLEASYIIQKLQDVAPLAKNGQKNFFIAYGTHKPHMPFYFPEDFISLYPMEEIDLPYNPHCPVDMPRIAWHHPSILKYKDCGTEAMGNPDLGKINVTWPNEKVKEIRRAYYATVSYVDHELGRVLKEVKRLGLENNTIIVFLADHGWQLGEHAQWGKMTVFSVANRVPLIMKIPGVTEGGLTTHKLVELVDIFPTLVEAAGFPSLDTCPNDSHGVLLCTEGSSLLPLFEDPKSNEWKDSVFWQYPRDLPSGFPKGLNFTEDDLPTKMGYTIRMVGYRYTEWVHIKHLTGLRYEPQWDNPADHEELYDLKIDPQENVNR